MEKNKKNLVLRENGTHHNARQPHPDIDEIQLLDAELSPEPKEISLVDDSNKFSVINLVHKDFKEKILNVPAELLEISLDEIKEKLQPSVMLHRLRFTFWNEYECAIDQGRMMRMSKVWAGICHENHFRDRVSKNQLAMAFILHPPTDYLTVVKESPQAGMENLRKIVSAKVIDDDGTLNPRAADVVIKGIALLDLRVKGAVIQRIDQRLVSLNMNKNFEKEESIVNPDSDEMTELPTSLAQLEKEIERVKSQLLAEPIRGVKTTIDLVNYAQRELDMKFFPEKETVDILPTKKQRNYKSKK